MKDGTPVYPMRDLAQEVLDGDFSEEEDAYPGGVGAPKKARLVEFLVRFLMLL